MGVVVRGGHWPLSAGVNRTNLVAVYAFGLGLRFRAFRGTSLMRKRLPMGTFSRPMPRALWWN